MKRKYKLKIKKLSKKINFKAHFLLFFLFLLLLISAKNNVFPLKSSIQTEKVFAGENTQTLAFLATPTPSSGQYSFGPDFLFPASPTPAPTATPTPTPQPALEVQDPNDFCLEAPILIYHHVQPLAEARAQGHAQLTVDSDIFDGQMAYLVASGYNIISVSDVVTALRNHTPLPAKSIVVTLDDGYDDFYNYAFPIAKKYNVKMDFMISSGLIGNPGYMNWGQLKEAAGSPLISIYNHTWSHAALGAVDRNKIEFEINTSQNELQSQLGHPINIFVYPYGSFSPLAIQVLQEHGFVGGISTIGGTRQCLSYIMTLHRTHIGNAPLSAYGF